MMRLIGYIRVSTDEQARDGQSLAIQDLQMHRFCELYGHELVDVVVDDGVSAGVDLENRGGGAALLDQIRDGGIDGVVVQRIDRLFRKTVDGLLTAAWFNRRGVAIQSINEHIDTGSPDGWLTLTILLATAEYERNKIAQRAREVSEGLREQGKAWGPTPYGCVRGDGDDAGKLFRDPAKWAVREQIVEMRRTLSLRAICAELRERGIPAPGGGRLWHSSTLKGILDTHHDLEHIPTLPLARETLDSEIQRTIDETRDFLDDLPPDMAHLHLTDGVIDTQVSAA